MFKSKVANRSSGFTLVEIIVAIAIAAIVAAIAIPAYQKYMREAQEASLHEALHEMREAISVYVVTHAKLPASDKLAGIAEYNVGMTFTIEPDAKNPQKGRLVAKNGNTVPFVIDMQADNGSLDWQCVPGSQAGLPADQVGDESLLPADCLAQGAAKTTPGTTGSSGTIGTTGSTPPPLTAKTAAISCPPAASPSHTDKVTVNGIDSCAEPCASGQVRDSANPGNCIADPAAQAAASPAPPQTATTAKCHTGQTLDKDGKCVLIVTEKPSAANNPCGPGGVFAPKFPTQKHNGIERDTQIDWSKGVQGDCRPRPKSPDRRTPIADPYATVSCHTCTGPIQICEQVHFPTTCEYPNNNCATKITNHVDGTRTVSRGCANYLYTYRYWYMGTSDNDKCDVIKNNQHVDFICSFACNSDNCNAGMGANLRPAENRLFEPMPDDHWKK